MKLFYRIIADTIVIIHVCVFAFVLFGWAIPSLWYTYMTALVLTLLSDIVFGYCIISRWEFALRKKINPDINYDYSWATYYTYKLTNHRMSNTFYNRAAIIFLVASLAINLFFRFLF
jgi:hypothetical protein